MLNLFYDAPVKILSSHIVIMSVYLILLDIDRLLRFFVLNQNVESKKITELLAPKYLKAKRIIKPILITVFLIYANYQVFTIKAGFESSTKGAVFYGKSKIESYNISSKEGVADSIADKWDILYQSLPGYANVKTANGAKMVFMFKVDTLKKQIQYKQVGSDNFSNLKYDLLDSGRYHLYGTYLQDSVDMILNKNDSEDYPLTNRGFHWINEYPHSR